MAKSSNSQKGLAPEHLETVKAVHPKLGKREFTLYEWNMMPVDKYGYVKAADAPKSVSNTKNVKALEKSVDTAQVAVDKAQKKYDAQVASYQEILTREDKEQEPQAKMKLDDAERALKSAQDDLAKAQGELTEANA